MHLNYVKVLVLLENCQSWRETLGSKFVSFGCSTHLINVLNTLIPDISTPIPNIYKRSDRKQEPKYLFLHLSFLHCSSECNVTLCDITL